MNTRYLLILGGVLLAVVVGAILFLQNAPVSAPLPAGATPAMVESAPPPVTGTPRSIPSAPPVKSKPASTAAQTTSAPPPLAEWELKIEQVLQSKANETETAQMLINLLPSLPKEGQAEAAQHITNLIAEPKDYVRILPLLRNPGLPEEVQDVLVTDLMNREDTVKLPALLDVAKIPNHPYHEEALTDLQIFLDQDNASNWSKWDGAVKAYLKKQQQEAATPEPVPGAPAQ